MEKGPNWESDHVDTISSTTNRVFYFRYHTLECRERWILIIYMGFPCGSAGKESTCNVEDLGSIPGLGRSPGEGKGYPRQFSVLENFTDCKVHGILQARILQWVALPFSRGSSQPRDWTQVSHIAGRFFTSWATREAQEYYPFSSGSSRSRNRTRVSCTAGGFFTNWAMLLLLFLLLLLLLSRFSHVRLCATPQTAGHQAPRPWDSPSNNTGVGCHLELQLL